jgi:hypothetical protein
LSFAFSIFEIFNISENKIISVEDDKVLWYSEQKQGTIVAFGGMVK